LCDYPVLSSGVWKAAADEVVEECGVEGLDQFLWAHFGHILGSGDRKDVRDCFLDQRVERQLLFLEGLGLVCKFTRGDEYRPGSWALTAKGTIAGVMSPSGYLVTVPVNTDEFSDAAAVWRAISRHLELDEYQWPSSRLWARVWSGHVYEQRRIVGLREALVAEARRREEKAHASN
jgi:hypothetical protein